MKIFKTIGLFILLILVSGCTNGALKESYNKMQVGRDKINGYILDLRISGTNGDNRVNEILRITNYQNKEYQLTKTVLSRKDKEIENTTETMYIKDSKLYVKNENGDYIQSDSKTYINIPIYLEGLINTVSVDKPTEEKIGENKYNLYDVVFKKEVINDILKDTTLNKMTVTDNVSGKVYIDKDKNVYRIIYNLDNITINASYFSIDKVKPINYPNL
jgi:hypothetical protein